jgi:pimeloyl-ACP methyl ester carboxylesterase
MNQLDVVRASFMGCSFGGYILLQASEQLGARMEALVLGAPAGLTPMRPALSVWPSLLKANLMPTPRRTERFLSEAIFGLQPLLLEGVKDELFRMVHLFQKYFRSDSLPPRTLSSARLRRLVAPTLVACGSNDRMVHPALLQKAAKAKLPSLVRTVVLHEHGHSLELSPEFVRLAASFLQKIETRAA